MKIQERVKKLQTIMAAEGIDAYIIPTNDYHMSEYVGEYFRAREYMSGFTGSAGTMVVLREELDDAAPSAYLWTDGRYFIQAEQELAGSGIALMKMGEPDVPKISELLASRLGEGFVLGMDGRVVSKDFVDRMFDQQGDDFAEILWNMDLVDRVWENRPALSAEPVWELPLEYAGETAEHKLARIREKMELAGADVMLVTALDDIAWTLNLRGNDVECNPVFLSYMMIYMDRVVVYGDERKFARGVGDSVEDEVTVAHVGSVVGDAGEEGVENLVGEGVVGDAVDACDGIALAEKLRSLGVVLKPYDTVYDDISSLPPETAIILDKDTMNLALACSLHPDIACLEIPSIIGSFKACKNETEIANVRSAHIDDGVAVTRFIKWVTDAAAAGETVTEISAAVRLEEFRRQAQDYLGPSFATICAYGEHGAIVHYEANENTNVELAPQGLLLVDSGGHYLRGTTDVTRTIPLGPLTDEEKKAYTLVLMGHLRLAAAKFPVGTRGENIDAIAREPLWAYGMDFNHGTGHGVGYLLNVHEGPQRISHRLNDNRPPSAPLAPGMITSNEPGYYEEGKFGIRHENLVVCQESSTGFLEFENLTWAPFDRRAVDFSLMTDRDVALFNAYQEAVCEKLAPVLKKDEHAWLRKYIY